jgi:hypothetical protein
MTSPAEWAITRRIKINATLSVDLTVGPGGAVAEWVGGEPKFLTEVERRRYRRGRDQLIGELATKLGGTVAVLEV